MGQRTEWMTGVAAALSLAACDAQRPASTAREEPRSAVTPLPAPAAAPAKPVPTPMTIDRDPVPAGRPGVVSSRDFVVDGQPGCAFEVRYPDAIDQPAVWAGEACADVRGQFVTSATLKSLGRLATLDESVRDEIADAGDAVFYIEGRYASAIYPLNAAGRTHRVDLAD